MPFTTPPTAVPGAVIQAQHRNVLRDNQLYFNSLVPAPTAANQVPILTGPTAGTWSSVGTASFTGGSVQTAKLANVAVTTAKLQDGGIDTAALSAGAVAALMPGRLVMMVPKAADIPTGWARETALDGRHAINAGTTFSVTFGEASDYGSSWSHQHTWSATTGGPDNMQGSIATITPEQVDAAQTNHTHTTSGTAGSTTWAIPSRAVVWMRKAP